MNRRGNGDVCGRNSARKARARKAAPAADETETAASSAESQDASSNATAAAASSQEDASATTGSSSPVQDAHGNLTGSLFVKLASTLDGAESADLSGNSLVKGERYTLSEQAPTAGYTCAEDATVTVGGDGALSVASPDGRVTASADGHTITVRDVPTAATVAKQDAKGKPLAGATYRVEAADGSDFADGSTDQQAVSDAQGTAAVGALLVPGATYTLAEPQAPAGFDALAQPARFTMDEVGTLTLVDDVE